jgi:hypothetical protein
MFVLTSPPTTFLKKIEIRVSIGIDDVVRRYVPLGTESECGGEERKL